MGTRDGGGGSLSSLPAGTHPEPGEPSLNPEEFVEVVWVVLSEALERVWDGCMCPPAWIGRP